MTYSSVLVCCYCRTELRLKPATLEARPETAGWVSIERKPEPNRLISPLASALQSLLLLRTTRG